MGKQWQDYVDDSYYGQYYYWQPQRKGTGKQQQNWKGKGQDGHKKHDKPKAGGFPKYDGVEPKQMVIIQERKEEQNSLVRDMQRAVTAARKAEGRTRKIQEDLANKEKCWLSYQQELKTAYRTELARYKQDVAKLKDELTEAMVQEQHAKQALQQGSDDHFEMMMQSPRETSPLPMAATPARKHRTLGHTPQVPRVPDGQEVTATASERPGTHGGSQRHGMEDGGVSRHTQYRTMIESAAGKMPAAPKYEGNPASAKAGSYTGGSPGTVVSSDPYMCTPPKISSATATPPIRKSPAGRTADGSNRTPLKQQSKMPLPHKLAASGVSLAEKLEAQRRKVEGIAPEVKDASMTKEPTIGEVMRHMRPADIPAPSTGPAPVFICDDEDSPMSEPSDFIEWAKMHSSDLPEMD